MSHQHVKFTLIAGFAIFSMFFGSGNLVFPLLIGVKSLHQYPAAVIGLSITAVGVPFLGLMSIILHNGNYQDIFDRIGKKPAFYLIFIILGLMGPFGAVPRCIAVAFGGITLIFPQLPLSVFSIIFCAIIAILIWKPNQIVKIIGIFLTPWKLGGLVFLICVGLWVAPTMQEGGIPSNQAFYSGLKEGYQTMDLLAAFFFSATTVHYLKQVFPDSLGKTNLRIASTIACLIGMTLLLSVYIAFILLGAKYGHLLETTPPELMLMIISGEALGRLSIPIVGFTMAISCLATSTILIELFANFISEDVTNNRLDRRISIILTLVIAFVISLWGFSEIRVWLGQILAVAYPALICLAVTMIIHRFVPFKNLIHQVCFWSTLGISLIYQIFY